MDNSEVVKKQRNKQMRACEKAAQERANVPLAAAGRDYIARSFDVKKFQKNYDEINWRKK